jgi:hypothetical protein
MDDVIFAPSVATVNVKRLINTDSINIKISQIYLEVYNCNIPKEVYDHMKTNDIIKTAYLRDVQPFKQYIETSSNNNINIANNTSAIKNRYLNAVDVNNNLFVDIMFPFEHTFDIHMNPTDFNKLIIKGDTFDGLIPINNIVKKNNNILPRYKINVPRLEYPTQRFIDDIYYGIDYEKETDFSVLANSVPFEMDAGMHELHDVSSGMQNVTYYIKQIDHTDILCSYTSQDGVIIHPKLMLGDRVYLILESITDERLLFFLHEQDMLYSKNFHHGKVIKNNVFKDPSDDTYYDCTIIKLYNLRLTPTLPDFTNPILEERCFNSNWELKETCKSIPPAFCFDSNWNMDSNNIISQNVCNTRNIGNISDTPCRYNYECPFFRSNSNYLNFYGGCLDTGYCEMPVGITRKSFKKYEINNTDSYPICYNCPPGVTDANCCEFQRVAIMKNDYTDINSNLRSPDYKFENDVYDRLLQLSSDMDTCKKNSLRINKYT